MINGYSGVCLAAEGKESLWTSLYRTYIEDGGVFSSNSSGLSVPIIILGLFLGLILAAIFSVISKRMNGVFVHKLIGEGALSAETSKTLPELDFADKLFIRYAVRKGVSLRRVVRCREEEEYDRECAEKMEGYEENRKTDKKLPKKLKIPKFKMNPDEHHFYIPEELKGTAETKFDIKGISVGRTVISVVALVAAFLIVFMLLPSIISLLGGLFGKK